MRYVSFIFILILFWSCEEQSEDLSCLNTSHYLCLSDVRFKVETDWINGGTDVSGGHYTLHDEPLTQEEWNALYGDYNLAQTTATYNNGDSSIIYFLDSLIRGSTGSFRLSEPCPSEPYLYVNEYLDSAMVMCTILDYTLLENSEYYNNEAWDDGNMKHCCHRLID